MYFKSSGVSERQFKPLLSLPLKYTVAWHRLKSHSIALSVMVPYLTCLKLTFEVCFYGLSKVLATITIRMVAREIN